MVLDQQERYEVISRYGRSYFSTDCRSAVPEEVLVRGDGYAVYIYLRANDPAQAFIGVRPHGSDRFVLSGDRLQPDSPSSVFRDRSTHTFRVTALAGRQLVFQVFDRDTKTTHSYSFNVGTVACTCKTYNAL